jgi:hypothetical protein
VINSRNPIPALRRSAGFCRRLASACLLAALCALAMALPADEQPPMPADRPADGPADNRADRLAGKPTGNAASAVDWPATLYNPRPADGDFLLPMPCGGAMTLRVVGIEGDGSGFGPLRDRLVELGSDEQDMGFAEYRRMEPIAGSFDADSLGIDAGANSLLMGKYEVNQLQLDAVNAAALDAPCPKVSARGRMPAGGIGWHAALAFTHNWSLWLRKHADAIGDCADGEQPCLPRVDGEPAFVRLPTDAEWEYVARGGDAVSPAEFRESHFPMPEGMAHFVWFADSADGRIRPIGVLDPNPAGVHDILGNLEEIVLDPFRLRRLDRPQGLVGGYVVRGGSLHSGRDEIRSALRREVPLYDHRGAVATADTGLRVLLSTPILTSAERLAAVRQAWSRLGSDASRGDPGDQERASIRQPASADPPPNMASPSQPIPVQDTAAEGSLGESRPRLSETPFANPMTELDHLARVSADPTLALRLERLREVIRSNAERLHEQRGRAAREALRFGGLLCQRLATEDHNLGLREQQLHLCFQGSGRDHPRCMAKNRALDDDRKAMDNNNALYADTVIRTARTYPDDLAVLESAFDALAGERIAVGADQRLLAYNRLFLQQVSAYVGNGRVRRSRWRDACAALGQELLND